MFKKELLKDLEKEVDEEMETETWCYRKCWLLQLKNSLDIAYRDCRNCEELDNERNIENH